jgi:hypothetical protein
VSTETVHVSTVTGAVEVVDIDVPRTEVDIPGIQGPPGVGGGLGSRVEEPFTSASVIVVNHNLGYHPVVYVIIGNEDVGADIVHSSVNQLTVTLGTPQTGKVVCL